MTTTPGDDSFLLVDRRPKPYDGTRQTLFQLSVSADDVVLKHTTEHVKRCFSFRFQRIMSP